MRGPLLTCRREILDRFLTEHQNVMLGHVIDIGGKKDNKRGFFAPPIDKVLSWKYVNIDAPTNPDYFCSAEKIPLKDSSIDTFMLCEVLEHLENPDQILRECFRIIKRGGYGIITMPFLFPIHADPWDFQRWTDTKLRQMLDSLGFQVVELCHMGGVGAVILDLLHIKLNELIRTRALLARIGLIMIQMFRRLFGRVFLNQHNAKITTGFGLIVKKLPELPAGF